MPQIFRRSANTLSKVSIFGVLSLGGGVVLLAIVIGRSGYVTRAHEFIEQPLQFSHQHHVLDDGIDCRYCHTSVETSAFAGIPPTKTCMNCHSVLFANASFLEPVRASFRSGASILWTRVHDLPDFVYFDHSIHVSKGVACVTCHGRVDEMPLMWQTESLAMEWCVDCHRDPEPHLGPRDAITAMMRRPVPGEGRLLAGALHVRTRTDCSTCHR